MMEEHIFMPLELEALVIDDFVGGRDFFRRFTFNYRQLDSFFSPEPEPLGNNIDIKERGIWLRWVLPRELRTEDEEGGFPLIPNRWLITRISQGTGSTVSWVLESDCPTSPDMSDEEYDRIMPYTTQYLINEDVRQAFLQAPDSRRNCAYIQEAEVPGCYYINLGIPFPGKDWEERQGPLFLTACAPGNPDFSGYVQFNSNILSWFDNLEAMPEDTFHYTVIGWYSGGNKQHIFCSGQVFSIPWHLEGYPKTGDQDPYQDALWDIIRSGQLNVAIGENPHRAFRAYFKAMLSNKKTMSQQEFQRLDRLMAALETGCLDQLQSDEGGWKLQDALQQEPFIERPGGTKETAVLDQEAAILHAMQEELLGIWWKRGYLKANPDLDMPAEKARYDSLLNAQDKNSLVSQTIDQLEKVKSLFAQLKEQEDSTLLGRYWQMGNPYVLVSGLEPPKDLDNQDTVTRKAAELLVPPKPYANPQVKGQLPEGVRCLYQETCYILEEFYQNPGAVGQGILPDYSLEPWRQPWKPAFMEWRINYQELSDYYFDGYAYQIDDMGKADPTKFCGFGGISVLNDHKQKLLAQKIEALPEKSGDKGLKKAAAAVRQWKLLGQELTHFHDQMEQRDCRAFRRPYDEEIPGSPYRLDEVLGFTSPDPDFFQRICQQIEGIPYVKGNVLPPYRFLRKGKAYLADLIFYDAFGRGLQLIRSGQGYGLYQSENFPLMIADSMKAKQRHEGNGFLLKPCILQYCRLAATLWGQGERPFFGFLTLNRLNHSLLVHSAEGEALGELMLMAVDGQKRRVCFVPFAGQPCPELAYFIQAQEGKEEADFQAFLDTIDASFWTMDAAGKHGDERMALLAGRPLAMSRLELYFDIYGLPRKDAGWGNDGEKKGLEPEPEKFPLRLGSLPVREDGICGYFADNTFSLFHSIASPQTLVPSLSQIGKKGPASQEAYLHVGYDHEQAANPYVLYDPLLALHAYTGILPVKRVQLEKKMVLEVLKTMELHFRMGPLLMQSEEGTCSVREGFLSFSEKEKPKGRTYQWLRRDGKWNER